MLIGVFVNATVPTIPLPNATVMLFSSVCSVSSRVDSSITSNSFEMRYLLSLVPRTRNRLPRSAFIYAQSRHFIPLGGLPKGLYIVLPFYFFSLFSDDRPGAQLFQDIPGGHGSSPMFEDW